MLGEYLKHPTTMAMACLSLMSLVFTCFVHLCYDCLEGDQTEVLFKWLQIINQLSCSMFLCFVLFNRTKKQNKLCVCVFFIVVLILKKPSMSVLFCQT